MQFTGGQLADTSPQLGAQQARIQDPGAGQTDDAIVIELTANKQMTDGDDVLIADMPESLAR